VTSPTARLEAGPTLSVFAVCFALNLPLGIVQRTQLGLQEGFLTDLWQLFGSALTLIGLVFGIHLQVGLPTLVLAIAGAPLLARMINGLFFFGARHPEFRPQWKLASMKTIRQIMHVGVQFLALQMVFSMAYSADGFVVARTSGAVNVPEYVVPQRIFSLVTTVLSMFVTPLWPAYAEALSRGDTMWIRHTLYRSISIVFLVSTCSALLLLLASRWLIHWWAGPAITPPLFLLVGLAIWAVMESCGNALAAFMNGCGFLQLQIIVAAVFGVSCITAKVYLAHRYGSAGLPWATIVTWGTLNFVPQLFYARWKLRRIQTHRAGACVT
jgi:O-antigen/teichoic acid export membrane protein